MTDETNPAHEWDGCLMCAVRALTEGRPKDWASSKDLAAGDTVTGVVLRMGNQPTYYTNEPVPFVDLWTGGVERVRITGHSSILGELIVSAELQVGDTVTVTFGGTREVDLSAKYRGAPKVVSMKLWSLKVDRGHH